MPHAANVFPPAPPPIAASTASARSGGRKPRLLPPPAAAASHTSRRNPATATAGRLSHCCMSRVAPMCSIHNTNAAPDGTQTGAKTRQRAAGSKTNNSNKSECNHFSPPRCSGCQALMGETSYVILTLPRNRAGNVGYRPLRRPKATPVSNKPSFQAGQTPQRGPGAGQICNTTHQSQANAQKHRKHPTQTKTTSNTRILKLNTRIPYGIFPEKYENL